jgi:AcrR family transcriptional regulator
VTQRADPAHGPRRGGRRGRRPGNPETRTAILTAARASFAASGFAGTTIRGVAAGAGVDPALVHHYFGTKDDLFMAALDVPVDPRDLIGPVVAAGPDGAGVRLVETFLSVWDDPAVQLRLLALARSAMQPEGEKLMTQGFLPVVIRPVLEKLCVDRPDARVPLVASQVIGLIIARYVLRVEPLASDPAELVAARVGPTIQRYLTGDLD